MEIRPHFGEEERTRVYMVEQSPLLQKAKIFSEMLKEGNEHLKRVMDAGTVEDRKKFDIQEVDEDEPYIQMSIIPGIFEFKLHEHDGFAPPDDTPLPPEGSPAWFSAGSVE